jgi:peptide deformylase
VQRAILELGDPLLHARCAPVDDPRDVAALIADLADTLASFRDASGFGRGIAAPQIGVSARVIFIRMQPEGFAGALVNPRLEIASDEMFELWDDCFSLPNLMVRVRRHRRVRVAYVDERGVARTLDGEDDLAELLQHEIDHLDGILATERAISPRSLMTRAEWLRQMR